MLRPRLSGNTKAAGAQNAVARPSASHAVKTLPAPVNGWSVASPLVMPEPASARVLDNWFPTTTGVKPRGGTKRRATIASAAPVVSMFAYSGNGVEKFFAATASSVFDITTVADPDTIPAATVTGQSGGYYSVTQLSNVAGTHLYACNGANAPLYYDGSSFVKVTGATTPAITGVTTSDLSGCFTYASRLFFLKKNSLTVHYLAVDAIGGAVGTLTLAGVMRKGGSLLFGATWSMDAGDGLDDKAVFVSDQGEVAVAEGIDPSDPASWRIVGVYDIGVPLGPRAWVRVGGELLIATVDGIIPLSAATQGDRTQLALSAVSKPIEPEWRKEALARNTANIEMIRWVEGRALIVSQPETFEGQANQAFVANIETRKWCRWTGLDTNCLATFQGRAFFGTSLGRVVEFDTTGTDDGALYVCRLVMNDDPLGAMGATKTLRQARATFRATHAVTAKLSASTDYAVATPSAPNSIDDFNPSIWDAAIWDDAIWDAGRGEYQTKTTRWQSIGVTGFSFLVACQIAMGITPAPDAEMVSIDVTFEEGGVVV